MHIYKCIVCTMCSDTGTSNSWSQLKKTDFVVQLRLVSNGY